MQRENGRDGLMGLSPRMRIAAVVLAAVGVGWLLAVTVFASGGTKVCVPSRAGKPIVTPNAGVCKTGYTLAEVQTSAPTTQFVSEEYEVPKEVIGYGFTLKCPEGTSVTGGGVTLPFGTGVHVVSENPATFEGRGSWAASIANERTSSIKVKLWAVCLS
jgi:hypothetical protein